MMNDFEDLDKMFADIVKEFPEKKKELIENVGEIVEDKVIENIDSRVGGEGEEKEKLKEDVKQVFGSKGGYVAVKPSYEHSGLNHLIENGHRIVSNGTVVGFANGKHMYRDSAIQCEDKIIKMAEDMVDEVIKDG